MPPKPLDFMPPVIAHRGANIRAPENTMAAFKAAMADGAAWIETDVKLTSDGMPILMHDDMLDRTTNGKGAVADMSWAEMRNLDAGKWFNDAFAGEHIPVLAELLAFAQETGARLNLELKPCPGRSQATAMVVLIEAAKLWHENMPAPLISSFDIEALTIAARLHPDWPRGLLLDEWRDDWRDVFAATQATTLNVNVDALTPDRLAMLRKEQVPVLSYVVNDPARAKELMKEGVRAVFSDNPALMVNA